MLHWKDGFWIALTLIVFLLALLLPAAYALSAELTDEETQLQKAYDYGEIIRIHIIANSDSPQDQAVKFAVRDRLLSTFGTLLKERCQDPEKARTVLRENVQAMEDIARTTALSMGFQKEVHAEFGILTLPEKRYGQVVLPSGEYHALRIVLGDGEGANWWCVLYPQLCLAVAQEQTDDLEKIWHSKKIFSNWLAVGN